MAACWALIAAVAGLLVAVELASRFVVPDISKIERRIVTEYNVAVTLQADRDSPIRALVVGNSLLGQGVEFEQIEKTLSPDIDVHRLLVENTGYLDWYYGLRRLIAEGARPNWVVVVLTADELTKMKFRGAYSAHRLARLVDIPELAAVMGLSNTDASGLVAANLSAFYGLREDLRKQFLYLLLPDLPTLTDALTRERAVSMPRAVQLTTMTSRLANFKRTVEAVGAKVIVIIPPTLGTETPELTAAAVEAGNRAGVKILVPIAPNDLGPEFYSDGFHLNAQGASVFTSRLAPAMRQAIAERR